jgi:mannose-6-phosphate isomerase-like protein (cupin superfamily)
MEERKHGYSIAPLSSLSWRESNMMKIPNADLLKQLGGAPSLTGRFWRMPPYSANTWHRHVDQWELYVVLEGIGRMRVGEETLTVPLHGAVLVEPRAMRQVFNDGPDEILWLILGAPHDGAPGTPPPLSEFYPEDPKGLPRELSGHDWPPHGKE